VGFAHSPVPLQGKGNFIFHSFFPEQEFSIRATGKEVAQDALLDLEDKWGKKYPTLSRKLCKFQNTGV